MSSDTPRKDADLARFFRTVLKSFPDRAVEVTRRVETNGMAVVVTLSLPKPDEAA